MSERKATSRPDPTAEPSPGSGVPAGDDAAVVGFLADLVQELGSTLELDQLLLRVANGVRGLVDYDTFAVLLLEDLGRELHFRFALGYAEEVVKTWRFGMGQGLVGTAAQTQQVLRVDDVTEDSRYIGAAAGEVRSEMAIPLVVKGRTVGVLDVGSRRPGRFTEQHERLLRFLTGHLANSIENARLYASVRDQARTLSLLHESSRELTSILDRDKLLRKIAEMVKRLIDYQLFSVMVWSEETQLLEHGFALGFEGGFCKKDGFPLGYGVTGTAAALRQPIRVPNVHLNPHYTSCGHNVEVHSELAVPLVFKDRLVGVLDLESVEYNAFTEQHEQMLSTLASYIAVALENARLYEKVSEGERRLEIDLETAREIQKRLLPGSVPRTPGLDVGFAYEPARQLGGDFYDFLSYGPDRLAIAVGDVAGKGTPAALYGSMAVGMLRAHVVEHPSEPDRMLAEMNRQLGRHGVDNRFVAILFGVFDGSSRTLVLANGGCPRPVLVRQDRIEELPVEGMPIGMFPDVRHEPLRLELEPGDVVVAFSDGVCESMDRNREEFGVRKLQALLIEQANRPAQAIADAVLDAARTYVQDSAREADDRTVVVLKVL
jgi:sigma-B regulation protein RsbU (phosphoserine phosphatase)